MCGRRRAGTLSASPEQSAYGRRGRPSVADQLAEAGNADGGSTTASIVEPLTENEREVLRNLAELFTTEEIAQTMCVSVKPVKTHVRGILRKLAVSRRNSAIRRARAGPAVAPAQRFVRSFAPEGSHKARQ
jgi:LuxR family transcriptional regulator, maltose regulon positive regulatory protein